MKYDIRGKDIKITKSIEEYIKTKIDKLEKYFNEPEGITKKKLKNLCFLMMPR